MTFSLAVRDPATGAFGSVICSSSPAVAARCVHLRDCVGAVHSQNITDPRLGRRLLDVMEGGSSALHAVDRIVATDATAQFRQLVAVDALGRTAVHSGEHALGIVASHEGVAAAAAGNMLASPDVPERMVEEWARATGSVEERLLAAFAAAVAAGGEAGPVHSAGLSVVSGHGWRTTDLRVDWSDDPLTDLRALLAVWLPQRDDYVVRAEDPARSTGYGVPGDGR
ncbi:DUF1028 domain-containing protein [Curtobacterium sp. NPDC086286]|uniref:DUF1028 domain-containing protein n=1 Tax=Curtobacterium sp. NPDC086286 TaxID=3363964 RepID=UPI00382F2C40